MSENDTLGETGIKGFKNLLQNERVESTFNPLIYMNNDIKPQENKGPPVGRNFITSPIRSGHTDRGGILFDREYVPLAATPGSDYINSWKLQKQQELESSKKIATSWHPSSPGKLPTGRGSHIGAFEKWPEHLPEPKDRLTKENVQHEKMPMYTSPMKKGHFGYNKLGIGPDYSYASEPEAKKTREAVEQKKDEEIKRRAATKDFVSADYGMREPSLEVFKPQPQTPVPEPRHAGQSKERIDALQHFMPFRGGKYHGTIEKNTFSRVQYKEEGERRKTKDNSPPDMKAWRYPGPGGVCPAQYSIQKYGLYSRTVFERSFKASKGDSI